MPSSYSVVLCYSRHPESDTDPAKVFPVERQSPDLGVARYTLSQIIAGPTEGEQSTGYFSSVFLLGESNCGGDFSVAIESGTAVVRFCRPLLRANSLMEAQARSQIEATLKQFATIRDVVVLDHEGRCLFADSEQPLCLKGQSERR